MHSPKQHRCGGEKGGAIVLEKNGGGGGLDLLHNNNLGISTKHTNDNNDNSNVSAEMLFGGVSLQKKELLGNGMKSHSTCAGKSASGMSHQDDDDDDDDDDTCGDGGGDDARVSVREFKNVAVDTPLTDEKSREETESSEEVSESLVILVEEEVVEEEIQQDNVSEHSYEEEVVEHQAQHFDSSKTCTDKDWQNEQDHDPSEKPARRPWSAQDFIQSEAFRKLGLCPLEKNPALQHGLARLQKATAGRHEEVEYIEEEVIEEPNHHAERSIRSFSDHGKHHGDSTLVETEWVAEEELYEEESIYEEECVEEDSAHYSVDEVSVASTAEYIPAVQAVAKRRGKRPSNRSGSIDQSHDVSETSEHYVVEESVSTDHHESFVEVVELSSPQTMSRPSLSNEDFHVNKSLESAVVVAAKYMGTSAQAADYIPRKVDKIGAHQSDSIDQIKEHLHLLDQEQTGGQEKNDVFDGNDLPPLVDLHDQDGPEEEVEENEDADNVEGEDDDEDEDAEERNDVAEAIKYVLRQEKAVDKGYVSSEQAESMVNLPLEEMNEILKHFELCDSSGTPIDWDLLLLLCEDEPNAPQGVDASDELPSGQTDEEDVEDVSSERNNIEDKLLQSITVPSEQVPLESNRALSSLHHDSVEQEKLADQSDGTPDYAHCDRLKAFDKDSSRGSRREKRSVRTGGSNTIASDDNFIPSDERSHSSGYSIAADGSSCESSITETECEYEYVEELIGSRHDRQIMTSHHKSMKELKRLHSDDF